MSIRKTYADSGFLTPPLRSNCQRKCPLMNSRAMGIAREELQHKLKRMLVKHGSGAVSGHGVANAKILRSKHTTVSQDEGPTVGLEDCEEGSDRQAKGKRYERRTEPRPRWLIVQMKSHA